MPAATRRRRRSGGGPVLPAGFDAGGFSPGFYGGSNAGFSDFIGMPPKLQEFFISPTGNAANPGTRASPTTWDDVRLGRGGAVQPGTYITFLAGEWTGAVGDWTIPGTVDLPIVLQNDKPTGFGRGVRAVSRSANKVNIEATNVYEIDIEITGPAGQNRISTQDSSAPTDINHSMHSPGSAAVRSNVRQIHCIFHDSDEGPFIGVNSPGYRAEHNIAWNLGWEGPAGTRGHGHIYYANNPNAETLYFLDCVGIGSGETLLHLYSTSQDIKNIKFIGCFIAHSGDWIKSPPGGFELLTTIRWSDPARIGQLAFNEGSIFANTRLSSFWWGDPNYTTGPSDVEMSDNIVRTPSDFMGVIRATMQRNKIARLLGGDGNGYLLNLRKAPGLTLAQHNHFIESNQYAKPSGSPFAVTESDGTLNLQTFAAWQALGFDLLGSQTLSAVFSGVDFKYRPSRYFRQRGLLHVWNWGQAEITGSAATDIITKNGHGFVNNQQVAFFILTGGAGFALNTPYFVVSATANTFQLSLTSGGAAINFTTDITDGIICPRYVTPDLTKFGFAAGMSFEIHHIYDYFGAPVVSGVFDGVTPPQLNTTGFTYPVPIDYPNAIAVTSMAPLCGVYHVVRTA